MACGTPDFPWETVGSEFQALDRFGVLALSEAPGSDDRPPAARRVPTDPGGGFQAQGC